VDGKNIFESACNAVEEHSKKRHFCFDDDDDDDDDAPSRVGRKNVSLPESEARSVNKFTAAARDSSLSAIVLCSV
jgi:hypothetical protein